jgi:hypothetical protein
MKRMKDNLHELPFYATMLLFRKTDMHEYYQINQEMICKLYEPNYKDTGLTQEYNHIPGSGVLFRKDKILEGLK